MKNMRFLLIILFGLSGCGGLKDTIGFGEKKRPDEFRVIKRAPLEVPYGLTLPVPQPGAPRPQEATPSEEVKEALIGEEGLNNGPESQKVITVIENSPSDEFLEKLGADETSSDIRDVVEEEYREAKEDDVPIGLRIINLGEEIEPKADIIDPREELEKFNPGALPEKVEEKVIIPVVNKGDPKPE